MRSVNNGAIVPQQYAQGQSGLGAADQKLLKTIFGGALLSAGRAKAGHGYMGLTVDGRSKAVPVKFLTHVSERGWKTDSKIMKENLRGDSGAKALAASDDLERELMRMAEKVGAGKTVRDLIDGYRRHADTPQQRALLSRKIVFSAASAINKKLNPRAQINVKNVTVADKPDDTTIATAENRMKANKLSRYSDRDRMVRIVSESVKKNVIDETFVNDFLEACKKDQDAQAYLKNLKNSQTKSGSRLQDEDVYKIFTGLLGDKGFLSELGRQTDDSALWKLLYKKLTEQMQALLKKYRYSLVDNIESGYGAKLRHRSYAILQRMLVEKSESKGKEIQK